MKKAFLITLATILLFLGLVACNETNPKNINSRSL